MKKMFYQIAIASVFIFFFGCDSSNNKKVPFNYILIEDQSFPGRSKKVYNAFFEGALNQKDNYQIAEIVMEAASRIANRENDHVVWVLFTESKSVDPSPSSRIASVHYAVDGKGNSGTQDWTWVVTVNSNTLTPEEVDRILRR